MGNIAMTFGKTHALGVNAFRVSDVLSASAVATLPVDAPSVTLTTATAGTGGGTVTSSPAGISCGNACLASFGIGASITLTATPDANSGFTGWSGACTNASGACSVTMDVAKSVTASFAFTNRTVSLTKSATGSATGVVNSMPAGIRCGIACSSASAGFPLGSAVTLSAVPSIGSRFDGWSGICTGTGICTIAPGTSVASTTAGFSSNGTRGVRQTVLSAAGLTGTNLNYTVQVPDKVRNLIVSTTGGTGNVNLYVNAGSPATLAGSNTCASVGGSNEEICIVPNPVAGSYYILLNGASFGGVTLSVTYDGTAPAITPILMLLLD
jgi:hypothetical protein